VGLWIVDARNISRRLLLAARKLSRDLVSELDRSASALLLSLFAPSDINRSGWGCALGAENSQTGEPLEPDPGHAGVGKPKRPNDRWSAESRFPGRPGGGFFVGAAKDSSAFNIRLNGEPYRLNGEARLSALIAALKMRPTRIAVELNCEVVPKADYDKTILKAGDQLEIINFVGGG
jgi:sulfur carrier protein